MERIECPRPLNAISPPARPASTPAGNDVVVSAESRLTQPESLVPMNDSDRTTVRYAEVIHLSASVPTLTLSGSPCSRSVASVSCATPLAACAAPSELHRPVESASEHRTFLDLGAETAAGRLLPARSGLPGAYPREAGPGQLATRAAVDARPQQACFAVKILYLDARASSTRDRSRMLVFRRESWLTRRSANPHLFPMSCRLLLSGVSHTGEHRLIEFATGSSSKAFPSLTFRRQLEHFLNDARDRMSVLTR